MNQVQKKYTVKRMEQLLKEVEHKLRKRYKTDGVQLTNGEKYDQIKSGKAKRVTKAVFEKQSRYGCRIDDLYKFTGEVDADFDTESFNKDLSKYNKELSAASDEVMLGDSTAALKMLKDFTDMCNKVK